MEPYETKLICVTHLLLFMLDFFQFSFISYQGKASVNHYSNFPISSVQANWIQLYIGLYMFFNYFSGSPSQVSYDSYFIWIVNVSMF